MHDPIPLLMLGLACAPALGQINVQTHNQNADKCFDTSAGLSCVGHPRQSEADFEVDARRHRIRARARLRFTVSPAARQVWFFFDPPVGSARLDGQPITVTAGQTPDHEQKLISLTLPATAGEHLLELDYQVSGLTPWGLHWQPFDWVSDNSDSSDARFINAFVPASYEADRYPMRWRFAFEGLHQPLQVFSSATGITRPEPHRVELRFDGHSQLSAPYFEIGETRYQVRNFSYQGLYQPIPVQIYLAAALGRGRSVASLLNQAEQLTRSSLHRFETDFGPYAFPQLLIKVYSLQTGDLPLSQEYSMEYGGAVVSRMELIPHEICHQWFGRGAAPADGRAGFVDEVVCDWYDYGHRPQLPRRLEPMRLGSPWSLRTPETAYQEGGFLGTAAWLLQQQGDDLLPLLREFYRRYRQRNYSAEDFLALLESRPALRTFVEQNLRRD